MDDKQLDKLFREKLYSHSSPVERHDELWSEISASMDERKEAKRVWRRKRMFYTGSSVAAVLILTLFLFAPNSPEPYISEISQTTAGTVSTGELPEAASTLQSVSQPEKQVVKKKLTIDLRGISPAEGVRMFATNDSLPAGNGSAEYMAEVDARESRPYQASASETSASGTFRIADEFDALWAEPEDAYAGKKKTKYLLALASNFAAGNSSNAVHNVSQRMSMAAGQNGWANGAPVMEQVSETKYSLPLNLGVQFQIRINSLLSVGAGVNYTLLRSKYDGLVDKKMHSVRQTLHYIGVPVNIYATILQKNGFFVYANAGGTIEKGVRASYVLKSYDETIRYNTAVDGVQFSVNFGMGAEYRFIKQLGVYLEPNAVYFFNSKVPNSIRTDQPFQLKAEIGFRFHL